MHGGAIQMLDDMEYLERAFQEARSGQAATLPFSDCEIPTVFDSTLAPEGKHIMSMFTQWVPESWSQEPHDDEPAHPVEHAQPEAPARGGEREGGQDVREPRGPERGGRYDLGRVTVREPTLDVVLH